METRNAPFSRFGSALVPLACFFSLFSAFSVSAQDDSEVFGEVIDVRVINLEVVVEEDGARVTGLGPDDFDDLHAELRFTMPFDERQDLNVSFALVDGEGRQFISSSAFIESAQPGERFRYDADTLDRESAAKVKVDSSRVASDLLVQAMEVCGGVACLDEFGLIRHHNDLFVTRVGEGSNFALKDLIVRPLRK